MGKCPIKVNFGRVITLFFVIWATSGATLFCLVLEHWNFRDLLYYSIVTFTTVGYGDITPKSDGGKMMSCLFTLAGHALVGVLIGALSHRAYSKKVESLKKLERGSDACTLVNEANLRQSVLVEESLSRSSSRSRSFMQRVSSLPQVAAAVEHSFRNILSTLFHRIFPHRWCQNHYLKTLGSIIMCLVPPLVLIAIGAPVVVYLEDWKLYDAIYWCTITGTTVGYGDIYPTNSKTKWFAIFFIPVSVGLTSMAVGRIASIFVSAEIEKNFVKLVQREVTVDDLEDMDQDGDGNIDKLEFVEYFLLCMQKVDKALLKQLHDQFEALDADGSGGLSLTDLEILTEGKLRNFLKESSTPKKLRRSQDSSMGGTTKSISRNPTEMPTKSSRAKVSEINLFSSIPEEPRFALLSTNHITSGQLSERDIQT